MSSLQKNILALFGAVVLFGAIYGAYQYPHALQQTVGTSPTGATFGDAKMAAIVFAPATAAATSTSLLNTDANDRFVTDNFITCGNATTSYTAVTGTGLANWTIQAATTSTNAPAVVANTNLVINDLVATGTNAAGGVPFANNIVASSTLSTSTPLVQNNVSNAYLYRWAAGSYLTIWANATNTAQCTVGVHYIGS